MTLKQHFHNIRRKLAHKWINHINPLIIAVSGSQGKTNTVNVLAHIFPNALRTDENLDTIYNVPITALKARSHHKIALFELGIDSINEMDYHLELIKPRISVITGVSPVHSDEEHLKSFENVILEKRKLVSTLTPFDYAILNWDDENVREMAKHTKAKVLFFGKDENAKDSCDAYIDLNSKITIDKNGTSFTLCFGKSKLRLQTKLFGLHHLDNILASFLTYIVVNKKFAKQLNMYTKSTAELFEEFKKAVEAIAPLKGRMNLEKGINKSLLLNDSLRSNPKSAAVGIETVSIFKGIKGRRILILGEMGELGDLSEKEHKKIGKLIANLKNINVFIGIGPLQKFAIDEAILNGFKKENAFYCENVLEASNALKELSPAIDKNDLLYIKGSKLRHLERVFMIYNDENSVKCLVTSCPLYNESSKCKFKNKGYNGKK